MVAVWAVEAAEKVVTGVAGVAGVAATDVVVLAFASAVFAASSAT